MAISLDSDIILGKHSIVFERGGQLSFLASFHMRPFRKIADLSVVFVIPIPRSMVCSQLRKKMVQTLFFRVCPRDVSQFGYPGLWTLYHTHEVDVHIMDPKHPALTGIGMPEGNEFRTYADQLKRDLSCYSHKTTITTQAKQK
eukprot:219269-Amphidinium_carterae.1